MGLKLLAHAGEEGPAAYVREALDVLRVDRIDHGNSALDDAELTQRLADIGMVLTVCPISNVKLAGVDKMVNHPLKTMLDKGLAVTVNSDDPAYFGGYINDNYRAVQQSLSTSRSKTSTASPVPRSPARSSATTRRPPTSPSSTPIF